jgi:L-lactate dehydrogenase (cytochrome)
VRFLADLATINLAEVGKHNTVEDFWMVIHGKVYDMTDFISHHPGGKAVLKQYAGKVALKCP